MLGNPRVVTATATAARSRTSGAVRVPAAETTSDPASGGGPAADQAADRAACERSHPRRARRSRTRASPSREGPRRRRRSRRSAPQAAAARHDDPTSASTRAATARVSGAARRLGLRAHGRCAKPTGRLRRAHARACQRSRPRSRSRATAGAGPDSVPFSGRTARGRALATGAYRLMRRGARARAARRRKPRTVRFGDRQSRRLGSSAGALQPSSPMRCARCTASARLRAFSLR